MNQPPGDVNHPFPQAPSSSLLPTIIILDLDQTIIGNVEYQVARYSIQEKLQKLGVKTKAMKKVPDAYKMNRLLVRPGFSHFITMMKRMFPWVIICVFTASERKWANLEISWLQQTMDFHPDAVFTRDDCMNIGGSFRKSVGRILPKIWRLATKRRVLTKIEKEKVLKDHLIIVDDNAVWNDYQDHLLLCPAYDYHHFEDITDDLTKEQLANPVIRQQLLQFANEGVLCPYILKEAPADGADPILHVAKQFSWMSKRCKAVLMFNRVFVRDRFWKTLIEVIEKIHLRKFTPSNVSHLQKVAWNKQAAAPAAPAAPTPPAP